MIDLAVVGQDPRYGGGALAQMEAFLAAARELGREAELLFVPHPALRPERRGGVLERVEPLRLGLGSRRLVEPLRSARDVWVVATVATHGLAAAVAGRPYRCWIGTSLSSENAGRKRGLETSRRVALTVNAPALHALERFVLRRAERIYATSPASRTDAAAAGDVAPETVGILPLPVDVEDFRPAPDEEWLAQAAGDAPVLAFVGRADDPRKNLPLAVAAFELLRERRPHARLLVVGSGRAAGASDGVELLGPVSSVAAVLRDVSLLLVPARQEGFGIAAAEAMAAGVPVVSTPCAGPEDMLRRSGGGVVTGGWDPAELSEAALSLLAQPERLLEMRRRGRSYVEREHSRAALVAALGRAFDGR